MQVMQMFQIPTTRSMNPSIIIPAAIGFTLNQMPPPIWNNPITARMPLTGLAAIELAPTTILINPQIMLPMPHKRRLRRAPLYVATRCESSHSALCSMGIGGPVELPPELPGGFFTMNAPLLKLCLRGGECDRSPVVWLRQHVQQLLVSLLRHLSLEITLCDP